MSKNNYIELLNDGDIAKFDVVATFENNKRKFVIFTDNKSLENGFIKTYAGIVEGDKINGNLSDEDLLLVENLINKMDEV